MVPETVGAVARSGAARAGLQEVIRSLVNITYRQARRLVIFIVGSTLVLAGIALIFLPGPAIVVIPAGLAVLSLEFAWAKSFLHRIRREISERNRRLRMNRLD